MVNITIDGQKVSVADNTTILEAAKAIGINIPTLCYLKDINEIGACRVCIVEIEGCEVLRTSCNTLAEEGMVIKTNSEVVREARKDIVKMILSKHDSQCTTCPRNKNCQLQSLAEQMHIIDEPYKKRLPLNKWNRDFPLIREESKCIGCLRCVSVCDKVQSLKVWDLQGTGSRAKVAVGSYNTIEESNCSLCGQCITHCPVGALHERDDSQKAWQAIQNPQKVTVIQIAPAVRTAWAEELGLTDEEESEKRMVAAAKALGFDYVLDTSFTADLTIMEEGSEFVERLTHRDEYQWPMFTSCCPGWIRFIKSEYPEYLDNLSTAKSPQQMFGAVIKTYFAQKINIQPGDIYSISVMPCTAKKYEADVKTVNDAGVGQDVDLVLTTRELARMIKEKGINVKELAEAEFDSPLGESTGAGVIFGSTGGVMEAALRSAYYLLTGKNPDADAFKAVRIDEAYQVFALEIAGATVKVAVSSGLGNARELIEKIKRKEIECDFVEIMACPGGCSGGGGQPIVYNNELATQRGAKLYQLDKERVLRFSHENSEVLKLYEEYLGKPLGEKSHHLLHTKQSLW